MSYEHSVIGLLVDVPGTYDEQGNELVPPTYLDGWHVNMTQLLPELVAHQVFPQAPYRVYAGAETVFLRFADKAEWLATVAGWSHEVA